VRGKEREGCRCCFEVSFVPLHTYLLTPPTISSPLKGKHGFWGPGDAIMWAQHSRAYRDVIAMLEHFVAELEERSSAIHSLPLSGDGVDEELRALQGESVDHANQSAESALTRMRSVLVDNERARELDQR
jgi:hypothetical protein